MHLLPTRVFAHASASISKCLSAHTGPTARSLRFPILSSGKRRNACYAWNISSKIKLNADAQCFSLQAQTHVLLCICKQAAPKMPVCKRASATHPLNRNAGAHPLPLFIPVLGTPTHIGNPYQDPFGWPTSIRGASLPRPL